MTTVEGTVETFDRTAFARRLANHLRVHQSTVALEVTAASVKVTSTVTTDSAEAAQAAATSIEQLATNPTAASAALGITVESIAAPIVTTDLLLAPSPPPPLPRSPPVPPSSPPPLPLPTPPIVEDASAGMTAGSQLTTPVILTIIVASVVAVLVIVLMFGYSFYLRNARRKKRARDELVLATLGKAITRLPLSVATADERHDEGGGALPPRLAAASSPPELQSDRRSSSRLPNAGIPPPQQTPLQPSPLQPSPLQPSPVLPTPAQSPSPRLDPSPAHPPMPRAPSTLDPRAEMAGNPMGSPYYGGFAPARHMMGAGQRSMSMGGESMGGESVGGESMGGVATGERSPMLRLPSYESAYEAPSREPTRMPTPSTDPMRAHSFRDFEPSDGVPERYSPAFRQQQPPPMMHVSPMLMGNPMVGGAMPMMGGPMGGGQMLRSQPTMSELYDPAIAAAHMQAHVAEMHLMQMRLASMHSQLSSIGQQPYGHPRMQSRGASWAPPSRASSFSHAPQNLEELTDEDLDRDFGRQLPSAAPLPPPSDALLQAASMQHQAATRQVVAEGAPQTTGGGPAVLVQRVESSRGGASSGAPRAVVKI